MDESNHAGEDSIQKALTDYAVGLKFSSLLDESVQDLKLRFVDTLGALFGGFHGEPARLGRELAANTPQENGATVIGTRMKTTPDVAAFVNAATTRYVEFNDSYHKPGSNHGHASDVLTPTLAAAEVAHASGSEFITAAALAYEVFLQFSNAKKIAGFDQTLFACLGVATASAKLFGLDPKQIHHAISMAIIPNNSLRQARTGQLSMWKAVASGQAGRSGVYAAMLAQLGFEGPHAPFEGKNGWLDHVARGRFEFDTATFGGNGNPFLFSDTLIKVRPACGTTTSAILAAEKAYELIGSPDEIDKVTVEEYKYAVEGNGTGAHHWNPVNRESADHSIPYLVATTLHDGTITPRQFDDAHLFDQSIRNTMSKIEVVENPEFSIANDTEPVQHRTRVTIVKKNGETVCGESGGPYGDLADKRDKAFVSNKFTALTQEALGLKQVNRVLDVLWSLEDVEDMAELPKMLVQ